MAQETEDILRKQILEELGKRKQAAKQRGEVFDSNNFYSKILDRNYQNGGYARSVVTQIKAMDKTMHNKADSFAGYYGEKSFVVTNKVFFETIDGIMARLGLQEEFQRLWDIYMGRSVGMEQEEALNKLTELLEPVYIELRMMGFSHQDLIG